jgi:hypothetical protein
MYIIEQRYHGHWEPVPNGEFGYRDAAESAMGELYDMGWHSLRIVEEIRDPYPPGLNSESARVAYDVPRSSAGSVIAELRRILDLCVDWGTPEAETLRDQCRDYLEDLGA